MNSKYKYDVALSFAGEDRTYVEKVAKCLKENGLKIFYDNDEQTELWGKDLTEYLAKLYKDDAEFCVIFISKAYGQKQWTKHERRNALERAFNQDKEYILPARFDDTEIPGIRGTVGFIDLKEKTPKELCALITEKVLNDKTTAEIITESIYQPSTVLLPDIPDTDFDEEEKLEDLFKELERFLDKTNPALDKKGIKYKKTISNNFSLFYKYKQHGKTLFYLKFWISNEFSRSQISFFHGWGEGFASENTITAWATLKWSNGKMLIEMHNLSLLDNFIGDRLLQKNELFEFIWKKIVSTIQSLLRN